MFSNRLVLVYAAAISFLMVPSCSKQSESDESGTGGFSPTTSVLNQGGTGSGNGTGNGLPGTETDPEKVGSVVQITGDQKKAITTSACNAWAAEPESAPAKLEAVIDISSSMNQSASNTGGRSKWEITKASLIDALTGNGNDKLGLSDGTSLGLMFYPNRFIEDNQVSKTPTDVSACLDPGGIKPMDVLGNNDAGTWRTELRQILVDQGTGRGTPTADAYAYALNSIVLAPDQVVVPGDPYMLLITDGIPTMLQGCYNPAGNLSDLGAEAGNAVVKLIADAWKNNGVRTFVIGSPGSESQKAWLSKAACEGQTGDPSCCAMGNGICHMDLTTVTDFSASLAAGLQQVANAVSGCKFVIPERSTDGAETVDPNKISPVITFGSGTIELATRDNKNGEGCTEGFFLSSDGSQMQLCTDTCNRFMADPRASLQVVFGCGSSDVLDAIQ